MFKMIFWPLNEEKIIINCKKYTKKFTGFTIKHVRLLL